MKNVVMISNVVMHYRVSVYNYFANRFKEDGWTFHVLTDKVQSTNKNSSRFDMREIGLKFGVLSKELLELKPDAVILFLHLKDAAIWPMVHWLRLHRIPFAYWTKGANLDDAENIIRHLFFRYLHIISNKLILYSDKELKFISPRLHKKVFVANNTINHHDFPEINTPKDVLKKEFGIAFRKVVLFAGRMGVGGGTGRKKIDHLVTIFNEISLPGVGLVIVGEGMPVQVKEKINHKNTMYLGEVHDPENLKISKLFSLADLFCIPGHVGLGLNQAMYFGLPVVTEEGLQPPEIQYLENDRNGFIVPEDDVDMLKSKIVYLLENDDIRATMGKNAKADILKKASIEGMYKGFYDCIESMV